MKQFCFYFSVQVQETRVQNNASGSSENEETAFERKSAIYFCAKCFNSLLSVR